MTAQQQLTAEANASFDRNVLMDASIAASGAEMIATIRSAYVLGFINGGDHVLSQVQTVQYS